MTKPTAIQQAVLDKLKECLANCEGSGYLKRWLSEYSLHRRVEHPSGNGKTLGHGRITSALDSLYRKGHLRRKFSGSYFSSNTSYALRLSDAALLSEMRALRLALVEEVRGAFATAVDETASPKDREEAIRNCETTLEKILRQDRRIAAKEASLTNEG